MTGVAAQLVDAVLSASEPLGESDCEELRHGLLGQPVLALSSLGFVAAGGWLLWQWRRLPAAGRWWPRTYAVLMIVVGAGSLDYHGPQSAAAQLLHDVPIALVLGQAAAVPVSRAIRRIRVLGPGSRRRALATCVLGALAVVSYAAGRTNSPLCDPGSWVQPHGSWHLLSAAALALWGTVLWPTSTRRRPSSSSGTVVA